MKAEIICEACKPAIEEIVENCKKYGESGEFVHGKARDDYLCDQCGEEVLEGHTCWAVTILGSRQNKPGVWEDKYIERMKGGEMDV